MKSDSERFDVFISHASEDKECFVRPLAKALRNMGAKVWFDEFTLRLGDSLSRSIDQGLASCSFAVVVISHAFIEKKWPEYELRGLIAREISGGRVILPIWLSVTRAKVLDFSPPLADKFALIADDVDLETLAIGILREIRPDLYEHHPRGELLHLALSANIPAMQEKLTEVRERLSEFQCPYCSASLLEQIHAPADATEQAWDIRQSFECGYRNFGGELERPCPADLRFPKLEDYEIVAHAPSGADTLWRCEANAKTPFSRMVWLQPGYGKNREEAVAELSREYNRARDRR